MKKNTLTKKRMKGMKLLGRASISAGCTQVPPSSGDNEDKAAQNFTGVLDLFGIYGK
jgi:hypothetical protein